MHFDKVNGDIELQVVSLCGHSWENWIIVRVLSTTLYFYPSITDSIMSLQHTSYYKFYFPSVNTMFQGSHFSRLVWSILHTNLKVHFDFAYENWISFLVMVSGPNLVTCLDSYTWDLCGCEPRSRHHKGKHSNKIGLSVENLDRMWDKSGNIMWNIVSPS